MSKTLTFSNYNTWWAHMLMTQDQVKRFSQHTMTDQGPRKRVLAKAPDGKIIGIWIPAQNYGEAF